MPSRPPDAARPGRARTAAARAPAGIVQRRRREALAARPPGRARRARRAMGSAARRGVRRRHGRLRRDGPHCGGARRRRQGGDAARRRGDRRLPAQRAGAPTGRRPWLRAPAGARRGGSAMLLERLGPNLAELAMPVPAAAGDGGGDPARVLATARHRRRPADRRRQGGLARRHDRDHVGAARRAVPTRGRRSRRSATAPSGRPRSIPTAQCWCTATRTGGTRCRRVPDGSSSSTRRGCRPLRPTTWPCRCASTTSRCSPATRHAWFGSGPTGWRRGATSTRRAVWQWGYIERVSTGLLNLRDFDDHDAGAAFLEVAAGAGDLGVSRRRAGVGVSRRRTIRRRRGRRPTRSGPTCRGSTG